MIVWFRARLVFGAETESCRDIALAVATVVSLWQPTRQLATRLERRIGHGSCFKIPVPSVRSSPERGILFCLDFAEGLELSIFLRVALPETRRDRWNSDKKS